MDRDRGILSNADRAFIEADEQEREENYSQPARSKRWSALSNRTYNGLLDGEYLLWRLPAEQREEIFSMWQAAGEPLEKSSPEWLETEWSPDAKTERDRLRRGLVGLLGFIYQGTEEADVAPFTELIERAIGTAEATNNRQVVDVTLDVTYRKELDTEAILERFQAGEILEQYELAHLTSEGAIDGDDLAEYYSTDHLDETGWYQDEDEIAELRDEWVADEDDEEAADDEE